MTRKARWTLGAILVVAAALMAYGMTADLPYARLGIERLHIQLALKYGSGDLNPHYFIHPPLLSYCLFPFYALTFVIGHLTGLVPSVAAFERLYFTDPSIFFVVARVFILLTALTSVAIFFRIGARLYGTRSALIAAAFVAWAPELVKWAHYALPTVLMVCLFTASFFYVVRVVQGGGWRDSLWAGFLGGLAIAAKYDGGAIVVPLMAGHLLSPGDDRRRRNRRIAASLACVALGAWIGNPFAPFELPTFLKDLGLIYRVVDGRMVVPGFRVHEPGWRHLVAHTLPFGWGVPLTFLSLLGVGHGLLRRRKEDLLLLSAILPVVWFVSCWQAINPRYLLHVMPLMILLGVEWGVDLVGRVIRSPRWGASALAAATALIVALPLAQSLAFDREVAQPPFERDVIQWIETHIAAGSTIATMADLPLIPNVRSIHRQLAEIEQKGLGKGVRLKRLLAHLDAFPITYDVVNLPLFSMGTFDESDFDFDRQLTDGIQYVILDQNLEEYRVDPAAFQPQLRYAQAVQTRCRLLQEFRRPWSSLEPRRSAAEDYVQIYRCDQPAASRLSAGAGVKTR